MNEGVLHFVTVTDNVQVSTEQFGAGVFLILPGWTNKNDIVIAGWTSQGSLSRGLQHSTCSVV